MDRLFLYLTDLTGGVAYWVIFGILIACGLGFPLPEDIPLVATGYLIWDETIRLVPALMITFGGVLIGDSILYLLGSRFGIAVLKKKKFKTIFRPKAVKRARAYFRKYGDKIVFFARFVAGFRAAAFFMAGAMHMKYSKFLWLDFLAALLSIPIWIAIGYYFGYFFGDSVTSILHELKEVKTAFTALIILIIGVTALVLFLKSRKATKVKKAKVALKNQ